MERDGVGSWSFNRGTDAQLANIRPLYGGRTQKHPSQFEHNKFIATETMDRDNIISSSHFSRQRKHFLGVKARSGGWISGQRVRPVGRVECKAPTADIWAAPCTTWPHRLTILGQGSKGHRTSKITSWPCWSSASEYFVHNGGCTFSRNCYPG